VYWFTNTLYKKLKIIIFNRKDITLTVIFFYMEDQSREYGQRDFSLPHDVVRLPSEGVFYKNKKKSVKVGYLTANDENTLMGGVNDITTTLLRNKIYEPDLKVEDMLEGDVEAILIFLRNTSFGPEMEITVTDTITRKPFQTSVDLSELSIIKGQSPNEDGTFTVTLPKSQTSAKIKPLTYGELMEIQRMGDSYPQGRVVPKITWRLNKQIVEIGGIVDKAEIAKFVEQMPIADSKYIKQFMDDNEPKLDMRKTVMTPSGEKLTVNVGFGADFFRPFF